MFLDRISRRGPASCRPGSISTPPGSASCRRGPAAPTTTSCASWGRGGVGRRHRPPAGRLRQLAERPPLPIPRPRRLAGRRAVSASTPALTGALRTAEVLVSSHSAPLMRLAAQLLCQTCRVIVHTDLEWPPFIDILRAEAGRQGRRLVETPVRELLLSDRANRADLIERISRDTRRSGADGMFLSEITSDGIRLPLAPLAAALLTAGAPRFVVVDAAQALGHMPVDVTSGPGDLYLGGCHKWVGSGFPLSVAVSPRRRTRGIVREAVEALLNDNRLDDPLLRFTKDLLSADGPETRRGTR